MTRDEADLAVRRPVLLVLGALSAFAPLSIDMYLPGLPAMSRDLDTSASSAALTLTACMLGLAAGQVLSGPVSDALGRRRPVLVGLALFSVASVLCALAPTITTLLVFRFLQGAAGAAGIVIARAVVRDLHSGAAAARLYALLMVVMGGVPVIAPLAGAQLLHVTDWRGIFLALAAIGAVLFAAVWRVLPETLGPAQRRGGGLAAALRALAVLVRERRFACYAAVLGLSFGAMAAYISGSPFALQNVYGVSPQLFSVLFAANIIGLMAASQLSRHLVERLGPAPLLLAGLLLSLAGGVASVLVTVLRAGLVPLLAALFVTVCSVGLTSPNVTALALADHRETAGAASGLLGLVQFTCGAATAPLVGIAGAHTARPMAVVIAIAAAGALVAMLLAGRPAKAAGVMPADVGGVL